VPFRDKQLAVQIPSFDLHEMLGAKMRALFQLRRGRDLFDLYWALTEHSATPVKPEGIVEAF
jgi:predicted nucleotidyltransferase component of viral defense system